MSEFLSALAEHGFLQRALVGGLLASVGCGVVGTYVVVKRIGYLAGGIAHAVLGGMGAALFFGASPLVGALAAAIASALIVAGITLIWREREDTIIGAVWAVGMAGGILFISQAPGYNVELMSYLFGNVLLVTAADLWLMLTLDLAIIVFMTLFYKQVLAVSFDEEFAILRGVRVRLFHVLLLCVVALTVVLMIRVVGLILVIALLTLPAAAAGRLAGGFLRMMVVACLLAALCTAGGLALSFAPDLPSGAVTVLLAGAVYLAIGGGHVLWVRLRRRGAGP